MSKTYDSFFCDATGLPEPYPYQRRFATSDALPSLLCVPTGVGKTATVVLGWVWRRRFADDATRAQTPRRLVYCLPMRTLVEQTHDACLRWLDRLNLLAGDIADVPRREKISVHVLMGGEDADEWDMHPERDTILIGTQDMLLSRALNRGYGMSRYRWPIHFGLLNNDCLWALDETQLMGVGVTTSAQLAGLREKLSTYGHCHTLWMSATLNNAALQTVDHPQPALESGQALTQEDHDNQRIQRLLTAAKPIEVASFTLGKESEKSFAKTVTAALADRHQPGTLTLAVANNVERAQSVFVELKKHFGNTETSPELYLIHSRYRPKDRAASQSAALNEAAIDGAGRIVVATQAIEAGVDISATTLLTELAPWSSLVQRFGRCNRRGICGLDGQPEASVVVVDIDTADGKVSKFTLPYQPEELDRARTALSELDDAGPQSLADVSVREDEPVVHVLRRKDLIDLFDTTPDLSGTDLDVSRYIRDADDTDVQVYWRKWDLKQNHGQPPQPDKQSDGDNGFPAPHRDELCSVSVGAIRNQLDRLKKRDLAAWKWDPLNSAWAKVSKGDVRPGMNILLHVEAGGYDAELGWTGDLNHRPQILLPDTPAAEESMSDDSLEAPGRPLALTQHLADVRLQAERLKQSDFDTRIPWHAILDAAAWHDVGKAHAAFQTAMRDFHSVPNDADVLWAKAGERGRPDYRVPIAVPVSAEKFEPVSIDSESLGDGASLAAAATPVAVLEEPRYERRRGFRHELASALTWLHQCDYADDLETNLIAYLIASHHGKVRLSIRSMPNEKPPADPEKKFARGLHEGDALPAVVLPGNKTSPAFAINLDLMALGESETTGPSWLSRVLQLRDHAEFGPFRLAFLETLLRIADWRGSANPGSE